MSHKHSVSLTVTEVIEKQKYVHIDDYEAQKMFHKDVLELTDNEIHELVNSIQPYIINGSEKLIDSYDLEVGEIHDPNDVYSPPQKRNVKE